MSKIMTYNEYLEQLAKLNAEHNALKESLAELDQSVDTAKEMLDVLIPQGLSYAMNGDLPHANYCHLQLLKLTKFFNLATEKNIAIRQTLAANIEAKQALKSAWACRMMR